MQVNIKDRQEVEATVEVIIPAAEVDKTFTSVLKELAGQVRIPGFRPGKVPPAILEKRVGAEALAGEVREMLIEDNYRKALEEADLKPVGFHYHGGSPVRGEDFTFDIHMDLAPEINMPNLEEIVIDTPEATVTDDDVAGAIKRLQQDNATLVPVDRPVQPGDVLNIETVSEDADADQPGSTMPVDMDAVSENLANQLLGKLAGDVVELTLNPEASGESEEEAEASEEAGEADAEAEAADAEIAEAAEAGADAAAPTKLTVRITDIREKDLPEADDDFAATLGFANWQEAEAHIRKTLVEHAEAETFEAQKEEFVSKILAETPFAVPNGMLQRRQEYLLSNLQADLAQRGMTMQGYLERLEERGGLQEFEEDLKNSAAEAVRRDLVLERLMLDRQTVLTDEEFEEAVIEAAEEEGTTPLNLRRERGEEWERNYRFLLQREKALDDAVREHLAAAAVAALG